MADNSVSPMADVWVSGRPDDDNDAVSTGLAAVRGGCDGHGRRADRTDRAGRIGAWNAMATSLAAHGGEALKRGHLDTASWALRPRRSTTAGRTTVRQFTEVRKYQVRDVVGQISTPLLS